MVAKRQPAGPVPRGTAIAPHLDADPRAEGFALLSRIEQARRDQPPGWTGDLDALESLVWRLLFLDREV